MRFGRILILSVLALILNFNIAFAGLEDNLKAAESQLKGLTASRGAMLSPKNVQLAQKYYDAAKSDYDKGKKAEVVEKKLNRALEAIENANSVIGMALEIFGPMLSARADCEEVEASIFSPELYGKAEKKSKDAISTLEAGKTDGATKKAAEAEGLYRDAELRTIKITVIGRTRDLIKDAEALESGKYSPESLARAHTYADEAENILNTDRYATDEAQVEAEEGAYEARHAMYITRRAKAFEGDKLGYEKLILESEKHFAPIPKLFEFIPRYNNGFQDPVNAVTAIAKRLLEEQTEVIESLRDDNSRLNKSLTTRLAEIDSMRIDLNSYRVELAQLKGEYEENLEAQRAEEEINRLEDERLQRIYDLFDSEDATVLLEDKHLIIRLTGLNFSSGKSDLKPASYALLSKVMSALQEYPGRNIGIEGHTDAQGRDSANQFLSEERAKAVREYILANNTDINGSLVKALGLGESKPVASNETSEGRAQNRRIDIQIRDARIL